VKLPTAPAAVAPMLGTGAVAVVMAAVLWRAFGGPGMLAGVLIAAAAVLVYSGYESIPPRLRNTAFLLFGLTILLLPFARSPLAALQRGIFISGQLLALISSVLLLAQCALRSPRVQMVGAGLRGQPPSRRYLSFTVASQMFSGMLGMAGAHIMLVMAAPNQETSSSERTEAVIGVMRGFGAAGFWSPVFGNMVILLALYPTLDWIEIFPVGFLLAQITLLVGLRLNRMEAQRADGSAPAAAPASGRRNAGDVLLDGLPLLMAMLAFMGLILTASKLFGIVISATIVMLAPLTALAIHLALAPTGRRWAQAVGNLRESAANYPRLASEALLFIAAGCAGSIMADAFPDAWTQQIGAALNGLPFLGLGFLVVAIMGAALAGIHPVLSAVFLASTITPEVLALPPVAHMAALLTGWGLSAVVTPFSVLSLTAARYAGTSLYQISFGKNWLFAVLSALLSCAALTLITLAMR
jgi:hypothetical protein